LKFTIRKRHVYIDICWPWIWNQYFYLGIWNDDRTKIIVFPSFQLVTRINSQNRNETELINVLWLTILCMNIRISNLHNWNFDPTSMTFFTLFHFFKRFLTSKYYKLLKVLTSCSEMERSEKRAFQNLKLRKNNQLKYKNQVNNRLFVDS
jgi:hypothetical protein